MNEELKALGLRAEAALEALSLDKTGIQHTRIHTPGTRRIRSIINMNDGATVGIIMMQILKITGGEYLTARYLTEDHSKGEWSIGDEYGDAVAHGQWDRCSTTAPDGGPSLLAQGLVVILEDIIKAKQHNAKHFGDFTG